MSRGEALYRLGLRYRRARLFEEAAAMWRELLAFGEPRPARRSQIVADLRRFAAEALAVHEEHRVRDYFAARELAMFALEEIGEAGGSPAGAAKKVCGTGWRVSIRKSRGVRTSA